MEKAFATVPVESFLYHSNRNDFSRWLFARAETVLASKVRPLTVEDFSGNVEEGRRFLIAAIHARRKWRQKGTVAAFDAADFDPDTDFLKIGKGSLGGKARGLVFTSTLLQRNSALHEKYPQLDRVIPHTLVLTTEGFDAFIRKGNLQSLAEADSNDAEIAEAFRQVQFPDWITRDLRVYLDQIHFPLAVRSSGLLEDAQFRAYAGLYHTCMIPNNHHDLEVRLQDLLAAVKMVFASTYFQGPKAFARRVGQRTEEEKMGVIIQELVGEEHNGYFYPAISGVAQSYNYYPFARMKPEEGMATIALGFGKTVVEGGRALRFSPKHPQIIPQFSSVDNILKNSQFTYYALKMNGSSIQHDSNDGSGLDRRDLADSADDPAVQAVASTYLPDEHRLKDNANMPGQRMITFAPIFKYKTFPLAELLTDILEISQKGMGCPVEIEFSVNLCPKPDRKPSFAILQVRPMTARAELMEVEIMDEEIKRAFCYSAKSMGNAVKTDMTDILFVKPDTFAPSRTPDIAAEIGLLNSELSRQKRPFVLIGPGRWGSSDRWLGIPVQWVDISGVGAMVEATSPLLKAEPSQGSHFFHNVTTLGINYMTVTENDADFINWSWLTSQPRFQETKFIAHVRLEKPFILKVDGRKSRGVMYV
ncbi:MAG: hypothetical protein HQK55_18645 [Deltaproteobacteria bacterium]|nr:hypothetical protein [Deltaproteobacteria bacterium]